jgi:hypothetical protein
MPTAGLTALATLISPSIDGASAVSAEKAREYGLSTVRRGGNRSSRYNGKARAD